MLPNFEEKLNEYYKAADLENINGETRPYDKNCLSARVAIRLVFDQPNRLNRKTMTATLFKALTNYQNDLTESVPEAVKMCDSWGAPFRYFGHPGKKDLQEKAP